MTLVLGFTDGDYINILFGCIGLAVPTMLFFLRYKAKSDKADIMIDVEGKIHEEIKPITNRMEKHDVEFKEFKRDEIGPMNVEINKLITKTTVIDTKQDTIIESLSDIKKLIGVVFDKLDTKQDKK